MVQQQAPLGMTMMPDPNHWQQDLSGDSGNYYPQESDLTGSPYKPGFSRDAPPGSKLLYPYSTLIQSVCLAIMIILFPVPSLP